MKILGFEVLERSVNECGVFGGRRNVQTVVWERMMGLDLYIEARIINRETGQVISHTKEDKYVCDADKGFFQICWWCGWEVLSLRKKIIEISNGYNHSDYNDSDLIIPIPQTALRKIYFHILNHAYLSDDTECGWETRDLYEITNLRNAEKLHDVIRNLHEIEYNNGIWIEKSSCISDIDWNYFSNNPQNFRWEFRLFNSE